MPDTTSDSTTFAAEQERVSREKLMDDLRVLTRDAEAMLKATAGEVGDKMSEGAREARSRLARALEQVRAAGAKWEVKAAEAAKKTDQAIRAHPYETAGLAFGLGLLIGVLIRRR